MNPSSIHAKSLSFGGDDAVEPHVGELVGRHAEGRDRRALPGDERDHRVLHPAVTTLRDGELRPGVGPEAVTEIAQEPRRPVAQALPRLGHVGLVEEVEGHRLVAAGHIVHADPLVEVVGVGGPREVVNVVGAEVPPEGVGRRSRTWGDRPQAGRRVVAVPYLARVLERARRGGDIV